MEAILINMNDIIFSKADLWADRIHAFPKSGLSHQDWYHKNKVPQSTLSYWICNIYGKTTQKEIHWLRDGLSLNSCGAFEERCPKIVVWPQTLSIHKKPKFSWFYMDFPRSMKAVFYRNKTCIMVYFPIKISERWGTSSIQFLQRNSWTGWAGRICSLCSRSCRGIVKSRKKRCWNEEMFPW